MPSTYLAQLTGSRPMYQIAYAGSMYTNVRLGSPRRYGGGDGRVDRYVDG
jgi:hypothetical protein